MKEIKIGTKLVGEGHPCFIIAEVGINHQGDINIAKKLIDVASFCGADAVKFQKRKIERILTKEGLDMSYDNLNSFGKTYGEHKYALELSEDDYLNLKTYAENKGLVFLASAWDEDSADFLESLGIDAYKVASADLTNLPLLEHISKKGKTIILSTGMATMEDVEEAVNHIKKWNDQLILLQCTSTYPCQFEEVNLNVMQTLKEKFDCPVGYSGHEKGIAISSAARALGACMIEKHVTLDRTMKGGDHAASLEPEGLRLIVRDVRSIEKALGKTEKELQESEIPIKKKLAKSLVSKAAIAKGTEITREMLTTKGPGTGLPPKYFYLLPGKKAIMDIPEDVVIKEEHIQW
ncbi:MAG: N-acetylneuraminate synthase family protein [Candidatus Margulisbacteria bacterium]|nr:N-acetylneuraminate synthase family protein [Candidatus Margulisiibacteriota bacterium]